MQETSASNVHIIEKNKDVLDLHVAYKTIVLYGTGEVANLLYEKYHECLKSAEKFIVTRTEIDRQEMFWGSTVKSFSSTYGILDGAVAVLVATHENVHKAIVENIRKYYEGDVFLVCEDFVERIRRERNTIIRMSEGDLAMTYVDIPNMGDLLNKILLKRLFDRELYNEQISYSCILGIGSLLEALFVDTEANDEIDYPLYVWGTGFNCDTMINGKWPIRSDIRYCCVRGYDTKKKLEEYYGGELKCTVGDPGLLACFLQDSDVTKRFSIGIIPHWREDSSLILYDLYKNYKNALLINLRNTPELVLHQIAECETIITSSLHGAIVADALGIPNVLVRISDYPSTDGFKYGDYYSVFGKSGVRTDLRCSEAPTIEQIKNDYSMDFRDVKKVAEGIRQSFPF